MDKLSAAGLDHFKAAELSDIDATRSLCADIRSKLTTVNALVLCAGAAPFMAAGEIDLIESDRTFAINVRSRIQMIQELLPIMEPGSVILTVNSSIAKRPLPESTVFAASMAASAAMVRSMAVDLADRGIRVVGVSHGPTDTPIYDGYGWPAQVVAEVKSGLAAKTLTGSMVSAESVAATLRFLISPAAGGIHGADLTVDAGYQLKPA